MNRRSFFKTLATAAAGFTILPPATTYERVWKAQAKWLIVNPEWVDAPFETQIFDPKNFLGEWSFQVSNIPVRRYRMDKSGKFTEIPYLLTS